MKKKMMLACLIAILGAMLLSLGASAEISTNLRKVTTYTKKNKVKTQSFVDWEGNVVVADDLGYATLENSYSTGSKLTKTEYFDAAGNPVNNSDGFSVRKLFYTDKSVKEEVSWTRMAT